MDNAPLVTLPTVRLPPFSELAAAARDCRHLQAVLRLAEWTGNRRLTKAGNLTLADARLAVREFDLPDHPGARAARGFPELQALWSAVGELELLGAAEKVDERRIVELWIGLFRRALEDQGEAALMRLYLDPRAIPESAAASLREIDAVDQVQLTDLGRFGLVHWFESRGLHAPFVTNPAEASVADLLELEMSSRGFLEEWLDALGPDAAAARLIEHARGGTPAHRVTAFGLLNQLGPAAADSIRACLDDRDLRPHANAWLSARGLPAGESSLDDLHRVFIDMVATDLDNDPDDAASAIRSLAAGAEYDAVLLFSGLWQCDHPATRQVLLALAQHHPDPAAAKAAQEAVGRL